MADVTMAKDTRFDFCKLGLDTDSNIAKVYRDSTVVAFMDANPAVKEGHTLVIPIRHYSLLTDMPDEEFSHLAVIAKEVAAAVKKAYHTDSVKIEIFDGMSAGGTVNHLHVHVIPRYADDEFDPAGGKPVYWKTYSERHGGKRPDIKELREIAARISALM